VAGTVKRRDIQVHPNLPKNGVQDIPTSPRFNLIPDSEPPVARSGLNDPGAFA